MPRITISYRREDSGAITGRIFDRLVARYGREAIFRDIDNIPIGVDFRQHIDSTLGETDVLLAIIGPRWVGPQEGGNRIQNAADPVRIEIEASLRAGLRVVPVLVMGAAMPTVTDLPESLQGFAYRNAVNVDTNQDFDVHMDRLIRAVDELLGLRKEAPPQQTAPQARKSPGLGLLLVTALGVMLLITGAAVWYFAIFQRSQPVATSVTASVSPPSSVAALQSAPPLPQATAGGPEKQVQPEAKNDMEVVFWQSIASSQNIGDFEEYLRKYPDGQFAGLARNRIAVLAQPKPAVGGVPSSAPSASASSQCGTLDEQIMQPVNQLYQAVNTKNLDLYAAQWTDDARYVDVARGVQHTKDEKIAERRNRFAAWEAVRLTMDRAVIAERTPDRAVVDIIYSMTVKNYGRPPTSQANVSEQYTLVCGPAGRWLIQSNIDENR